MPLEPPTSGEPPADLAVGESSTLKEAKLYVDGEVAAAPTSLHEVIEALEADQDAFAWLGMYRPSHQEMQVMAHYFQLNPLAVEDTVVAHQRPKLERYEQVLFLVLRAARYLDAEEDVEFGEVHAFFGSRGVITVQHAESPNLGHVRRRLEEAPDVMQLGPSAVLLGLLDSVVDGYEPVVAGIENDLDEIETQVMGDGQEASTRIYKLSRELIEFQRAVRPLRLIIETLRNDPMFESAGERRLQVLRDIEDHAININERVDALRDNLHGIMQLNLALQAQAQNEEVGRMTQTSLQQADDSRRIAAWAGVLFVPTVITGIYGMNFINMPELEWPWGYPIALGLMVVSAFLVYLWFKSKRWL